MNAAYFPQISQSDVSGDLGELYEDMRAILRVPWVAFGCRVLASFPAFLPMAWKSSAAAFNTRYVEDATGVLRKEALLGLPVKQDLGHKLAAAGISPAELEKIRATLHAFNYGNPKYLLLITAWSEALQLRQVGTGDAAGWTREFRLDRRLTCLNSWMRQRRPGTFRKS